MSAAKTELQVHLTNWTRIRIIGIGQTDAEYTVRGDLKNTVYQPVIIFGDEA